MFQIVKSEIKVIRRILPICSVCTLAAALQGLRITRNPELEPARGSGRGFIKRIPVRPTRATANQISKNVHSVAENLIPRDEDNVIRALIGLQS